MEVVNQKGVLAKINFDEKTNLAKKFGVKRITKATQRRSIKTNMRCATKFMMG